MYVTMIKGIIFALILCKVSISDIRTRTVENYLSVMIVITAFIGTQPIYLPYMIAGALIVPLPLFMAALIKPGRMGGADIKVMSACSFLLGIHKGMTAMIFGLALSVICTLAIRLIKRKNIKDSLPLAAYLSAGCILAYLIL